MYIKWWNLVIQTYKEVKIGLKNQFVQEISSKVTVFSSVKEMTSGSSYREVRTMEGLINQDSTRAIKASVHKTRPQQIIYRPREERK